MRIATTEVSPTDPGIRPRNISIKLVPAFCRPSIEGCARGVAPEKPSTRLFPDIKAVPSSLNLASPPVQTVSPDILLGYEKNRNARVRSAGFQMFIPVPPKTSFPMITAKATAIASIHRGTSTGTIRGMSIPDTR